MLLMLQIYKNLYQLILFLLGYGNLSQDAALCMDSLILYFLRFAARPAYGLAKSSASGRRKAVLRLQ